MHFHSVLASTEISFVPPFEEPVLVFATVLLLLLLVPLIGRKLRLPAVVSLLIAGIIVGPNVLNILIREGTIELLGTVGIIYIMFTAGLEVDLNGFLKHRNRSLVFGSLTFALPMTGGILLGYFLFPEQFPSDAVMMGAILLGSTVASHTLLSYPTISRLGLSQNGAVTTAVGGTIITDTAALLVLAVLSAMRKGDSGLMFWTQLLGGMLVFTLFTFWAVPRLSRWFFRTAEGDGPVQFLFALSIVFVCATGAVVAGMEDIIGAFFAGLAINRLIPARSTLMDRIEFVGNALFIPIFLLSVGMLVKPSALFNLEVAAVAAGMIAVLFITKFAAAWLSARIFRYSFDEGMVMYSLSLAQAAATLAAVFVGQQIGLFNDVIMNATIAIILVSCLVSPIIAERSGRRVALKAEDDSYTLSESPQRLLIPLANPNTTEALMAVAVMMHDPKSGEPLYPLTVALRGDEGASDDGLKIRVAQGEKNLERAIRAASSADLPVKPITKVELNVADGIKNAIVENRIRTVLIGWNGQATAQDRIFGSILDRLVTGVEETIFVYKHSRPVVDHKRVIVAIPSFSTRQAGFADALHEIYTLNEQLGAKLHIVTPRDSRASLERSFNAHKPAITAQWHDMDAWEQLLPALNAVVTPTDLLIFMSARPGSIAYGHDLDRLPKQLAAQFDANNFITIFPRNEFAPEDRETLHARTRHLRRAILRGQDPVQLTSQEDEGVIRELISRMPGAIDHDRVAEHVIEATRTRSLSIHRGVVFIELHDPDLNTSALITGYAPADAENGVTFPTVGEPVHHVWMFISGNDITESEHDQISSHITQNLRNQNIETIARAKTRTDVFRITGN